MATSVIPEARAVALDAAADRLLIEGLSNWIAGYATGDLRFWQEAWDIHAASLGPERARQVVERLALWARMLRDCAECPLQQHCEAGPDGWRIRLACLGAIAACQHGDAPCFAACLELLVVPEMHAEAIAPAVAYAEALKEVGIRLTPIPLATIQELMERPRAAELH